MPVHQIGGTSTAPGSHCLGTLTDPTTGRSQRLRVTFTEQQGVLLRAEVTAPGRPADHRPLSGELVLPRTDASADAPHAPHAPDDTKNHPIQLTASADVKPEALNGRSGLYWGGSGPVRLRPTDQDGLGG